MSRRNIAAAFLGALGVGALTACTAPASAAPALGAVASALASGGSFQWVSTIVGNPSDGPTLRTLVGNANAPVVVVGGYSVAGDGGGGIFYWDASASTGDDGGTVVVPSPNPANGRWVRIFSGPLDVRWFGADATGSRDSRAAFEAAIAATAGTPAYTIGCGQTVAVPFGTYRVDVPQGRTYALRIPTTVTLLGVGGKPSIIFRGVGDAIVIEGDATRVADYSEIRNVFISSENRATPNLTNGIVVHAAFVTIEDTFVSYVANTAILVESGLAEGMTGTTFAPSGTHIITDTWRLHRIVVGTAAVGVHVSGEDSNVGLGMAIATYGCGIGIDDHSESGAVWIATLAESGTTAVVSRPLANSVFIGAYTDGPKVDFSSNPETLTIGGSIAGYAAGAKMVQRVGRTPTGDGSTLEWVLDYQRLPYSYVDELTNTWAWRQFGADPTVKTDSSPYGAPFAWSDSSHPRGAGLPLFGNPLLNSKQRWSFRKTGVTLKTGANAVYFWGDSFSPVNNGVAFQVPPSFSHADTRLAVDVEIPNTSFASAGRITVGPHALSTPVPTDNGAGRNAAVWIYNDGDPIVVDVLFHFEAFVTLGPGRGAP